MAAIVNTLKVAQTLKYDDIESKKHFRIEPSRRATKKTMDSEQWRIFANRQKRLPALWRGMGIVSWEIKVNTDFTGRTDQK